ncbi:(d)CMP kinase [Fusobacterium sp. IOR10]|uniref:(d)CMP kinase n=1 Tax=Fusobacterium sp. IOR10 TaxID=2665157 RepID=UPI0013D51FCF|nr:(d)CMP kinase [Fusobacterium sp. IOR10]
MGNFIVAIDGPAGSGKSTIAKLLAKRFNLTYLDTGAMYRMVALYFLNNNVDFNNIEEIKKILPLIEIDIINEKFILNGEDVSSEIRTPRVTEKVSFAAKIKEVREKLVILQRKISFGKDVVLDGRDIGTVVFPNADLKIFLVASPEERARRRVEDYAAKGIQEDYDKVIEDIRKRDYIDSHREESPLKKAKDAIELDSSLMKIDETVDILEKYIKEKKGE